MKITYGRIQLRDVCDMPIFLISIGNSEKVLSLSVALNRDASEYDHLEIATALRSMANELSRQPI